MDNTIIQKALELAKEDSANRDPSHDFYHIKRVLGLATFLAHEEDIQNIEIIQLGAILHDISDYKYNSNNSATGSILRTFFEKEAYPKEKADLVIAIVNGLGFHKELENNQIPTFPELDIVADADKLDAMGAFGIARAFSFGAIKNRPIYDSNCPPRIIFTKEEYMQKSNGPTFNHFYEKLLKLKDMMRTQTGKILAIEKHQFMESYIKQLECEAKLANIFINYNYIR